MSTLRILHLSDTHLFGDDARHYGVIDTAANLRRALEHVADEQLDLIVCTGDVSEDGSVASYQLALQHLEPWAQARGARLVFAAGNHDERAAFREVLGAGQPGAAAAPFEPNGTGGQLTDTPIASVASVNGWRTIVLDSSVPGAGYGALDPAQLDFLADALATPAEHGSVLVMHHPPVAAQTDLLQALALDDAAAAALWNVLSGTDVRAILCGHYHLPIVETVDGITVVVAPGVANLAGTFGVREHESASDVFGGAVVEIGPRSVRALPFTKAVSGEEVFHFDTDTVKHIIDVAGRP